MENPKQIDIVRRAYELWEQAGKPEGRDQEFYHQAEQELRNADKSSPLRTPDNLQLVAGCDEYASTRLFAGLPLMGEQFCGYFV
jgi:hypothetical protein